MDKVQKSLLTHVYMREMSVGVEESFAIYVKAGKDRYGMATIKRKSKSKAQPKRWSQHVMQTSNALDLDQGVFTREDPRSIARSLKRSAERSQRRKSSPYRSAMSMLTFYINRAGKKLPQGQRARLEAAKDELRALYGKERRASK